MNPIGAEVLGLLKEDKSPEQIKEVLLGKYEVEKSLLEKDVDDFLTQLQENNMMQR